MNFRIIIILLLCIGQNYQVKSQEKETLTWWNPLNHEFDIVEGRGSFDISGFNRLPEAMESEVRKPVWNLSQNAAGLMIRFRTNSPEISVKYKLKGELAMHHMPITGVSGLDLYAKDSDGGRMWVQGRYNFDSIVTANFSMLKPNDRYHNMGREYQLYLPLYNSVESLEIGLQNKALFKPLAARKDKPIVVYGTSIAQGACASRPGMAWTAILERKMDRPLINLGFSGNGRLEMALLDHMNKIDAKIYILDCLPNLGATPDRSLQDVKNLILSAVRKLRNKNTKTPILLVEHAGYTDDLMHLERKKVYSDLNKITKEAFAQLKSEGIQYLHLLTRDAIELSLDATVDGTHPNDLGMQEVADAYEKILREILNEPIGEISTTIPVTQSREWHLYRWEERHKEIMDFNKKDPPKICFLGNSIVHFWGGLPEGPHKNGAESWNSYMAEAGVRNFGYGWDRVENVLWRVYHGELDGFKADQIAIMLGTNNLHLNSHEEIIEGLKLLVQAIKIRQPAAKILLIGILPRKDKELEVDDLNLKIAQLAGNLNINYADIGRTLLNQEGRIVDDLFTDGLHPNNEGYARIAKQLIPHLK
jgi:lysophospholipase L1-like esterase